MCLCYCFELLYILKGFAVRMMGAEAPIIRTFRQVHLILVTRRGRAEFCAHVCETIRRDVDKTRTIGVDKPRSREIVGVDALAAQHVGPRSDGWLRRV